MRLGVWGGAQKSLHTLTSQERSAANKFYWLLVVDIFFGLTFIQVCTRVISPVFTPLSSCRHC